MDDLRRQIEVLIERVGVLERENAELQARNAELEARNAELERQLQRRGKKYTPKANVKKKAGDEKKVDRRTKPHRQHPGSFREPPQPNENTIFHDVRFDCCPHCGDDNLRDSGRIDEHFVEEIPEPKVELHCYRRHEQECQRCGRTCQGRGQLEIPGSHIGPRARLLAGYCRAHLGISLEKTDDLLLELFGLSLSRAGTLGHVRWSASLFEPVVEKLFDILRDSPVIHADETGWRIDGKNVWAWCFSNPRLALFLIDESRSANVIQHALGETLEGVLVTDFYSAYNRIKSSKQKCLVHLLRSLRELRDQLPRPDVAAYIEPLMTLLREAMELSRQHGTMEADIYASACETIENRLDALIWQKPTEPDCCRINKRLVRHRFELLTFLKHPDVPADNNLCESDIRSVVAARNDGGVNRSTWGAKAFATLKSVIRTCHKNGLNFLKYGQSVLESRDNQSPIPLPLNSS